MPGLRRLLGAGLAGLLLGGLAVVPTDLASAAGGGTADAASVAFVSEAQAVASRFGHRVEVSSQRSETDQVFVNPNGSLTREQALEPVRVRRGGSWADVDSTLRREGDGRLHPVVGVVDLSFSAGGSGAAVAMVADGSRLELSWPTHLPTPTVSGATATYAEVAPGVDLVLSAVGTSFTQRVVVKTPDAARSSLVRNLTLGVKVAGGSIAADGTGYVVRNKIGERTLVGSTPLMWDSAGSEGALAGKAARGGAASGVQAEGPGDGADEADHQAPLDLSISKGALKLTPDTGLLDAASTVYPVTIDPTTSPAIYNWAMVNKTFPTTKYYNFTSADEGVGYNNFDTTVTKRIYYSFPTSAYNGKTVSKAVLKAYETYSATCSAGTVNAYLANDFSSSITWNTQPSKILSGAMDGVSTKAGRSDCSPAGKQVEWDVTSGVKNRVTAKASRSTFLLQASTESSYASWMRFGGPKNSSTSKRPVLSVTYNTTPTAPSLSSMWVPTTSKVCTSSTSTGPVFNPATGTAESMYAKVSDPDGSNVWATMELTTTGGALKGTYSFASRASGSTISQAVPSGLTNGNYRFRVMVGDGIVNSTWSPYCYFNVDTTGPSTPTVTNSVWTEGVLAPNAATSGRFTMTSSGATDMWYRWDSDPTSTHVTTTGTSTASATMAGGRYVDFWRVQSRDAALNSSGTAYFYVTRSQAATMARYRFNGAVDDADLTPLGADDVTSQLNSDSPLADSAAQAEYTFPLDMTGADVRAGGGRWNVDASQQANNALDTTAGGQAGAAHRPVVGSESFAIGAWVRLEDDSYSQTILAQLRDANPADPAAPAVAYTLGYDHDLNRFVATLRDGAGASVVGQAADDLPATIADKDGNQVPLERAGSWVYLAMVYDATAKTLRLNASHELETDPPQPGALHSVWHVGTAGSVDTAHLGTTALGEFRIGNGGVEQATGFPLVGLVDNVSVWQGVPSTDTLLAAAGDGQ